MLRNQRTTVSMSSSWYRDCLSITTVLNRSILKGTFYSPFKKKKTTPARGLQSRLLLGMSKTSSSGFTRSVSASPDHLENRQGRAAWRPEPEAALHPAGLLLNKPALAVQVGPRSGPAFSTPKPLSNPDRVLGALRFGPTQKPLFRAQTTW